MGTTELPEIDSTVYLADGERWVAHTVVDTDDRDAEFPTFYVRAGDDFENGELLDISLCDEGWTWRRHR